MRVLVLGHTGYLGGHVAGSPALPPDTVLLRSGRSSGAELRVDLARVGVDALAGILESAAPDAVINCAGAVGGDAVELAEVNARGPAVLCAALRRAAPGARLVHLGSAAEYGPGAEGVRVTESAAARPVSPYGATKLAGTVAVASSGLDAVVLRVGNPVGPGAPSAGLPGRVAGLLRTAGRDPAAVLRLGDLSAYRDFVDVRDVARAAVLAATVPGPLPGVLNIGGGRAVPVRELVASLVRAAGFRGRVEEAAHEGGSARSAGVSWQCSDSAAAGAALGWRPSYSLDDSAAALWAARAGAGTARPKPLPAPSEGVRAP
ncbi:MULTISPECIES: NAD-dependent epimerase/dehydratase family protein [unclassified Streptomyces]|uniref:NAD-dependent epimerase/dehydratase family protein n=2 Tax=Streptomyces TaxID=1883 RepID=A0ABV8N717_9ACTN|nr:MULTISPECIES: NAD-dependent epimerase/dehydratase family protein [unclassified Streptomyces]AEN13385.1 NAD-dependent epimerase/dehydratase [Streptomyces sp. SirexAA-E]MBK3596563.1 NAD(P)-dependent oxidoreductase [Streptomyces sp. MBT51]MYR65466.1 NAD-dependent epimerase/dehydratase family protein [Streptomyces sp. SID4939]MYT67167.1 NAD-dependent epimerase/dehydratase family protein [Streptomyces sp. SID8357]MYT84811.1 NAD-dependent epimerase/dehydratase family protein [Streptomyces sp. SID